MARKDKNRHNPQPTPHLSPEAALSQVASELRLNEQQFNEFKEMVGNIYMARENFVKKLMDPRRDINDECGYPSGYINPAVYQELYEREAVAERVVKVLPEESWQIQPWIYENEDPSVVTPFEEDWYRLCNTMMGSQSWYNDQRGYSVWSTIEQVDVQCGIGSYGVILLGLDDGFASLKEPVRGINELNSLPVEAPKYAYSRDNDYSFGYTARLLNEEEVKSSAKQVDSFLVNASPDQRRYSFSVNEEETKGRKLLFSRVFPESLAQITRFEANPNSPRFGQPVAYDITLHDPREASGGGIGLSTGTYEVHWTRVVHVVDDTNSSIVFHTPRMRPVLNRLLDLRKLYGGSAEMYWKGAFFGIALESHPQLGDAANVDWTTTKSNMENYMNGLQRFLGLVGMSAKTLAPQVVDPKAQIEVQIDAICIQKNIPKRIFMGSERGQLASSQDDATWNDRLRKRQCMRITPRMIVPFVDRLITVGVLRPPQMETGDKGSYAPSSKKGVKVLAGNYSSSSSPTPTGEKKFEKVGKGYIAEWPDITSQTAKDKTVISVGQTKAIAQYVKDKVYLFIAPMDFLTRIMNFSEEAAQAIIDRMPKKLEEWEAILTPPKPVPGSNGKVMGDNKPGTPPGQKNSVPQFGRRASDDTKKID